jgi:hypothetical protein
VDGEIAIGTVDVTAEQVRLWAADAIQGWLTGRAPNFDEIHFQRFTVKRVAGDVYEVQANADPLALPRKFRITVTAEEVGL